MDVPLFFAVLALFLALIAMGYAIVAWLKSRP